MGIDVGGTNVKIGIVDREGGMESKVKYATADLREWVTQLRCGLRRMGVEIGQVRPEEEAQLFQSNDIVPQYPEQCRMPDLGAQARRLAESPVSQEEAEGACSHLDHSEQLKKLCVYDVLMTGEMGIASAGTY